jgi:hypothetical protein
MGVERTAWPADKVERWPLAKLMPHVRNARRHPEKQVRQIARAIERWAGPFGC